MMGGDKGEGGSNTPPPDLPRQGGGILFGNLNKEASQEASFL